LRVLPWPSVRLEQVPEQVPAPAVSAVAVAVAEAVAVAVDVARAVQPVAATADPGNRRVRHEHAKAAHDA